MRPRQSSDPGGSSHPGSSSIQAGPNLAGTGKAHVGAAGGPQPGRNTLRTCGSSYDDAIVFPQVKVPFSVR